MGQCHALPYYRSQNVANLKRYAKLGLTFIDKYLNKKYKVYKLLYIINEYLQKKEYIVK